MAIPLPRALPRLLRAALVSAVVLTALPTALVSAGDRPDDAGVTALTGAVELTADDLALYSEPYVRLANLVDGPEDVPGAGAQVAAPLVADGTTWSFTMPLPAQPRGSLGVAAGGSDDRPQVYSVDIVNNMSGTPFIEQPDLWFGGNGMFSSTDYADTGLTGQLAVWSDGEGAEFPSGAGDDGQRLTDDDPTERLGAGWTVVDISQDPYEFSRDDEVEIDFPSDAVSPNDLSDLSWTDAFDELLDELEARYAFTDVKDIDFDALRDEYRPRVQAAEADDDQDAYTLALYQMALSFGDGHVGATRPTSWLVDTYGGSYGLRLGQADDGTVYVAEVTEGSSADDAGIEPGDAVTRWDGRPTADALAAVELPEPVSSEHARERKRVRWLTRGPVGSEVEVEVRDGDDPDARERTETLTADRDIEGLDATFDSESAADPASLPVTAEVLPSGVGYIRITTFYVDVALWTHSWDYAISTLRDLGVRELVIDVRGNSGGLANLAVYATALFAPEDFTLDTAYYNDGDGTYQRAYDETIVSGPDRWHGPVAVLVDEDCVSTCDQFAGTMAAIDSDDISLVGYTPSSGVYAAVDFWDLPGGEYFQASVVRFQDGDDLYLEGQGAPVDVDVPVTRENLMAGGDPVLDAAVELVTG